MPRQSSVDEVPQDYENRVSNLPLLFAAGYPSSLEKITEAQLEMFIPFMVRCSLGRIQQTNTSAPALQKPEWWPDDVKFGMMLKRPSNFRGNWYQKMKDIVLKCYTHHKSIFLLRFCKDLIVYPPEQLRFINNFDSTTSLFDRVSNRLLVTFRNENMVKQIHFDKTPEVNVSFFSFSLILLPLRCMIKFKISVRKKRFFLGTRALGRLR